MKTTTHVHSNYFISKHMSEVLESSIFTPHRDSDNNEGDLFVKFVSGKTYFYPRVRTATFIGLILADSVGRYFNANIRHLEGRDVTENTAMVEAVENLKRVTVYA